VVAYGKSGRSGAALRGLRAAERLGGWASHTGTIETSTRMTATTLTTGAWFGRNRLLKIHIGRVGVPSQSESTWRNQRWKRTDPDGVVLHGLLNLRPTLPLERIAMAIDEAVARALAASGYGPRYRRPDWTTRPPWAMSSSLCDRSAEE
jgi:hypothetical protein